MSKIMQINITCGVGSTGKLSEALYYAAEAQGFESLFAYSAFSPSISGAFSIETKFQNYLRRGENRFFGKQQKHSNLGTKRLISYIDCEKPDLIHLHNIQQNSVSYPMLLDYLKRTEIPIVYTLHDCWAFTGGCYYFTLNHCDGYKRNCEECHFSQDNDDVKISARDSLNRKQRLLLHNKKIHFVCVSKWLKSLAEQSYLKDASLSMIYNGVDTDVFRPLTIDKKQAFNTDADFIVLGVAGYWTEKRKGGDILVEVAKEIFPHGKVVLIGTGSEQFSQVFPEGIIGINRINDQRELAKYYSAADVFVNASQEETFGLTTAEAMACGTPSIVFRDSACAEIINEQTGEFIENDVTELVNAIYRIINRSRDSYRIECRNRANRFFDTKVMEKAYLNLYRSVL